MRTEGLPTTVFLELSIGNIEAAVAVSLIMIAAALRRTLPAGACTPGGAAGVA